MEPSDDPKVVPLRKTPRLHRDEAIVLGLYRRRRDALAPRDRERLAIVEALLFQDGVDAARQALAAFPGDVQFEASAGTIYHAYCPVRNRFTLTDFELPAHGGGIESGVVAMIARCAGGLATRLRTARTAATGMLSSMMRPESPLLHRLTSAGIDALSHWLPAPPRPAPTGRRPSLVLDPAFVDGGDERGRWRFLLSHAAEWSTLGGMVTVTEELESPFSRSILHGEYLCRVGHAADTSWWSMAAYPWSEFLAQSRRRRLYDDVSLLLSTLSERSTAPTRARTFLTGDFAVRDLAADERLLGLVRSELLMRVSSSVYMDAVPRMTADDDRGCAKVARERTSEVFRRYALVAELYLLASRCFEGPPTADVATAVVADYADASRRGRLEQIVQHIAGYESWLGDVGPVVPEISLQEDAALGDATKRLQSVLGELLHVRSVADRPMPS